MRLDSNAIYTSDERLVTSAGTAAGIDYLRRNLDKRHDIDSIAGYSGMSRRTLTRHFIRATGMTVGDWLSAQRLQRSQELL